MPAAPPDSCQLVCRHEAGGGDQVGDELGERVDRRRGTAETPPPGVVAAPGSVPEVRRFGGRSMSMYPSFEVSAESPHGLIPALSTSPSRGTISPWMRDFLRSPLARVWVPVLAPAAGLAYLDRGRTPATSSTSSTRASSCSRAAGRTPSPTRGCGQGPLRLAFFGARTQSGRAGVPDRVGRRSVAPLRARPGGALRPGTRRGQAAGSRGWPDSHLVRLRSSGRGDRPVALGARGPPGAQGRVLSAGPWWVCPQASSSGVCLGVVGAAAGSERDARTRRCVCAGGRRVGDARAVRARRHVPDVRSTSGGRRQGRSSASSSVPALTSAGRSGSRRLALAIGAGAALAFALRRTVHALWLGAARGRAGEAPARSRLVRLVLAGGWRRSSSSAPVSCSPSCRRDFPQVGSGGPWARSTSAPSRGTRQ